MSKDIIFPDGLMVKAPRDGAPEFVKGAISIKRQEFMNWLGQQPDDWINLDIKVAKVSGKWYSSVNTHKPDGASNATTGNDVKLASDFAQPDQGFSAPPAPEDQDSLPF